MKPSANYPKHLLQWGVLIAIVATILWATFGKQPVDVEKYCPFGGLQAFGTYLVNHSLACSMSMLQIMMGLVLAVGVILFSRLFCGYLCPLGTLAETMGRVGEKLHLRLNIASGSVADRVLRAVKYLLLATILYFTLSSSELFCKNLDPYYAMATGFKGEITLWMSLTSLALLLLGGFFVKMFWCKYICPLGAASNIFKFTLLLVVAAFAAWVLGLLEVERGWLYVVLGTCLVAYIVEMVKLRSCTFPLMKIVRDTEACNECGLCTKKCPYHVPVHDYVKVKHVDCTMCGQCISSCNHHALAVNGKRSLRWLPAALSVVLFAVAVWLGQTLELPTIDEKWGNYEEVENLQSYETEGLQTIKCFGSSKAFSAKMQTVPGVYGVRTFVRRHGVEVFYDPKVTDTMKIQAAIFTPTQRKYATPSEEVPYLERVKLGVEGLRDRMDMVYFGMALQQVEGIYGFTADFNCPVDVMLYTDPAVALSEEYLREVIGAPELKLQVKEEEKSFPMHTRLVTYAKADSVSREEFVRIMFRDLASLRSVFTDNNEKWGDVEAYPCAVYEMPFPEIDKVPVRQSFPYFKSFLSCTEGILVAEVELQGTMPVLRIHYVASMWDDERIWKEIFNAESWTLRMADGTFQASEPRLKFTEPGHSVAWVAPVEEAAEE